ncbi:hypothetical protein IQ235_13915 [Oscillatoriales cyanobacterium LEGE 11467]|uniref:Uncharacterized protein n=1 Tax=Zarconia navalis LEGE 11467 TaxID=1828826 RepID=A0A928ZAP2_9CYAN|nr:hypothetical protein [Zarconia navalis]MBE9041876.1 hypothetical protein [Zarconia navalis LEGE 11467]
MSKHINLLGYSLWVESPKNGTLDRISPVQPLYSPTVLAAYSFIVNLFSGCLLYGVNLSRRGKKRQGRLFVLISGMGLFLSLWNATLHGNRQEPLVFLFDGFIVISLYRMEKPHFEREVRRGCQIARWWPPFIWIILTFTILWVCKFLQQ